MRNVIVGIAATFVLVCVWANAQETRDFEQFVTASPSRSNWLPADQFPQLLNWLSRETVSAADQERKKNLLTTKAYVQFCNADEKQASQTIQTAIDLGAMSDRTRILAVRILATDRELKELDRIPVQSPWYNDSLVEKSNLLFKRGKFQESYDVLNLDRAARFAPDSEVTCIYFACALLACGQNSKAVQAIDQFLNRKDPTLAERTKKTLLFLRAVNAAFSDDFDRSYKMTLKSTTS